MLLSKYRVCKIKKNFKRASKNLSFKGKEPIGILKDIKCYKLENFILKH